MNTLGLILVATLPLAAPAQERLPEYAQKISFRPELGAQVPTSLEFSNQNGSAVRLQEGILPGKPAILIPVYYECPRLCTLVLNGLIKALKVVSLEVGKDYSLIAVSINPEEAPGLAAAKRKSYGEHFGSDSYKTGWHFLTGSQESIQSLARSIGFQYARDPETGEYAHAAGIVILTPKGKISKVHYGVDFSPREVKLSLVEAAEESIGSFVDQLLLLCYKYDPSTGKYTLAVLTTVRLGGILTVLAIGGFIGISLYRNRRKPGVAA